MASGKKSVSSTSQKKGSNTSSQNKDDKLICPINYNFGKHWQDKIVAHLDNPTIQEIMKDIIYCDYFGINPDEIDISNQNKNIPYPMIINEPGYLDILDDRINQYMLDWQQGDMYNLPVKYIVNGERLAKFEEINPNSSAMKKEQRYWRHFALNDFFTGDKTKYFIETYLMTNKKIRHQYVSKFMLLLAKLVEPNEEWIVLSNDDNSIVINKERTKMFDLISWCSDGRLEHYIYGGRKPSRDTTLGGKKAYIEVIGNK
jgi:hypothetical protein